jgi:hypothetical protein
VIRRVIVAVCVALLLSCSDNAGPTGVPNTQLHIIKESPTAPPLAASQASFWAKVGESRELRLGYKGLTPTDTGQELLRFEVAGDALFRKPDGTPFQAGDSILITITIVDTTRFLFRFDPSGLAFNPAQPARLKVYYYQADHDFNGDGVIDSADTNIEHQLDVWRSESVTAPWFPNGSVKFEQLEEIDANIQSFTEYAIAW